MLFDFMFFIENIGLKDCPPNVTSYFNNINYYNKTFHYKY